MSKLVVVEERGYPATVVLQSGDKNVCLITLWGGYFHFTPYFEEVSLDGTSNHELDNTDLIRINSRWGNVGVSFKVALRKLLHHEITDNLASDQVEMLLRYIKI